MEAFAYFPSLVYREEKPEWIASLLGATEPHFSIAKKRQEEGIMPGPLLQTEDLRSDPALGELRGYLLAVGEMILRDQGYAMDRYQVALSGLWGQCLETGAGTDMHVHKNSQLSGWVFLETPENGAYPIFKDPRYGKAMVDLDFEPADTITQATNTIYFNNVVPGTILIANSWLPHQVVGNGANTPTKTVHFIITCHERGASCFTQ